MPFKTMNADAIFIMTRGAFRFAAVDDEFTPRARRFLKEVERERPDIYAKAVKAERRNSTEYVANAAAVVAARA